MKAHAATEHGVWAVDVDEEEVLGLVDAEVPEATFHAELPLVISGDRAGSTVVAVVDRRPPLMVSHDAGRTWREAGHGLPPGCAVSISAENPDWMLFAARNRLYLSTDGARFWRVLAPELPRIERIAWAEDN